jgi:hypothetical protein
MTSMQVVQGIAGDVSGRLRRGEVFIPHFRFIPFKAFKKKKINNFNMFACRRCLKTSPADDLQHPRFFEGALDDPSDRRAA